MTPMSKCDCKALGDDHDDWCDAHPKNRETTDLQSQVDQLHAELEQVKRERDALLGPDRRYDLHDRLIASELARAQAVEALRILSTWKDRTVYYTDDLTRLAEVANATIATQPPNDVMDTLREVERELRWLSGVGELCDGSPGLNAFDHISIRPGARGEKMIEEFDAEYIYVHARNALAKLRALIGEEK